jgi:hypothetical protein
MSDYAEKVLEKINLDKPKQVIFDTIGFSAALYDTFMELDHGELQIDVRGNVLYPEVV